MSTRAPTSASCPRRPRRVVSWRSKRWPLALRSWRRMPAASARALHLDAGRAAGRGGGLMRWLTHLGGARVTIGIGLGLIAVGEQLLGLAALFALTTSHLAVQVLKRAVARPRPCDATGRPLALIDLPDPFSFPSGHAAAASAVGGTIAIAHPALAPVLLPLAALIAGSRVSLRVHHLGDVVGGALLGLIGAIGAALLILR